MSQIYQQQDQTSNILFPRLTDVHLTKVPLAGAHPPWAKSACQVPQGPGAKRDPAAHRPSNPRIGVTTVEGSFQP